METCWRLVGDLLETMNKNDLLRCPRSTIAINLPHKVVQDQDNQILRKLAEEFIAVSLLTNRTITVSLIDGDMNFEPRDDKSSVRLNLEHLGCEIDMVRSSSVELKLV